MFEFFDPVIDFRITSGASLPHWFQPGVTYFITFRTVDSIPMEVARNWHTQRARWLERHGIVPGASDWNEKLNKLPKEQRKQFHQTFSQQYLDYLDKGWGACVLKQPALARIVGDSLMHFDGDRYHLGDFVVMPNHVHLLVCLLGGTDVLKQCYSWKKFTAAAINRELSQTGRFWQEESFDHLVRSSEQFQAIQQYIRNNPKNLNDGEFLLRQF